MTHLKRKHDCSDILLDGMMAANRSDRPAAAVGEMLGNMVTVKLSQKLFTEEEISRLTGICPEHLHSVAQSKHLGSLTRAAEAAGERAERWLFTHSDLMVLAVLIPRCHH